MRPLATACESDQDINLGRDSIMRLQLVTWPEVDEYLKTSSGIIIPIGSTEQHGPTGLVGTDALTAEAIGQRLGSKVKAYVAPTINVGMAQHHLGFSGSMALKPTTLIAVIKDMVGSLAVNGFKRFFFVNGHGGNIATVTAAFSEIYADTSFSFPSKQRDVKCVLHNWYLMPGVSNLAAELYGEADGSHATASEVAVTYALFPKTAARVQTVPLEPEIAPEGKIYDARDYREKFPDGRIGSNPGLAKADHGERLMDVAVEDLARLYIEFNV